MSSSLNLWLLDPLDAVRAAEQAYRDGHADINAVEGFVRQILGWREYVWAMYWLRAEAWRTDNALGATAPLPEVFWTGETDLECLRQAMTDVRESGYAHHILRLMVLGNLQLLLGVRPWESVEWLRSAFVDGAEWVMAPNRDALEPNRRMRNQVLMVDRFDPGELAAVRAAAAAGKRRLNGGIDHLA